MSVWRERDVCVVADSQSIIFSIFFDDTRSDFFLLTCSIAEKAPEQLKMSLSRVNSGKTVEIDEKVGFE